MLVLYNSTTTSFSNLGIGVLKDFLTDPIVTEELNGAYTLEFDYSISGYLSEQLNEGAIIKANGQPFRIWNIKKNLNKISILAKHIFFDLSTNFLEDVAPTELNSQNALAWILERTTTKNNFIVNGDCSSVASARYVRKNVTDAIYNEDNAILKRFGGELEFDKYNVFVHTKRGSNTNFSIRYRKNLNGIEFNLDFSTVATRIMPQGANELLLDEKYIDSPKISNYFTPFYKKVEFGDIGVDDNTTEEEAKQKLIAAVEELYASGIDVPLISIKVDFIELSKCSEYKKYSNLESCSLGDTVKAIIPELNLNLETRIVKTIYNCNLQRFTSLELGSTIPDFVTSQSNTINNINNALLNIDSTSILSKAQQNAENLINHPFNGNVYMDKNSGVIYLLDTNDPLTAQNVWKWSLGGLGFSSTGVNGTYETAITQDGSIVANFITTGVLSTNVIEGFGELVINVNSNTTAINNNYQDLVTQLGDKASTENLSNINSKVEDIENLTTDLESAINDIEANGVSQVQPAPGFKFNNEGLSINREGAPTGSQLDEAGLEILDKTGSEEATQFYSGYVTEEIASKADELSDYKGQTVTYSKNIVFNQYLETQNGRIENVYDDTYGKGIGFFVGGDS